MIKNNCIYINYINFENYINVEFNIFIFMCCCALIN